MNRHEKPKRTRRARRAATHWRRACYEILEHGTVGHRAGSLVSRAIVGLITINLIAVTLQSVPQLHAQYGRLFDAIEILSLVVFTIEYFLRLWVAAEHAPHRSFGARQARLKFVMSPLGIIDLLAVLPFWFAFAVPADLRVMLIFRCARFLKLIRYSPAMRSLLEALITERRALFGCFVILVGTALLSASIMHLVEGHVQPDKFGTIPDAMWWAIVTLGTIGYGDSYPITGTGRLVASFTIFLGLIMIALPVGIIATAFSEEVHRREFVVTWGMVARVPLFSELQASDIADVMKLLRAQQVEAGETIVRRGENAHSMYFIAAGEVEIALKNESVRLSAGHFFGEIAALRRSRRTATVTAVTRTSLLVLDANDLHALMEREPRVAARIEEVMQSRLGSNPGNAQGDLVAEEIEGAEHYPAAKPADS
jgi:voltage-gated potassium channel